MRNKPFPLLLLSSAFLVSFLFLSCGTESETQPLSVVIFIADDVSVDDLGAYGNKAVSTPIIDSLAAHGLVFSKAFLTTSSCSPSRASILTGRYPHNTGAPELHMPLPGEIPTLAGQLKEAGYFTGASGKWHLGPGPREDFEVVYDSDIGPGGEARWGELIAKTPQGSPFFLWLASTDAHRGWGENVHEGRSHATLDLIPPYMVRDTSTREDFQQYYDEITRFDSFIGKSLGQLRDRGMLNNTLILILADNGRPFPRDKTRLYDSGIQTPLIAYWENGPIPAGATTDALVSVLDLAPTISQVCGLEPLPSYQGIAFSELFQQPAANHRNFVFAEHNWHDYAAHERMVRSADWLYLENAFNDSPLSSATDVHGSPAFLSLLAARELGILDSLQETHFIQPRPAVELYQVGEDPYQLNNLAGRPETAEIQQKLADLLRHWREATGDTTPENPTRDHYDYYTTERYSKGRHFTDIDRGEIPGSLRNAQAVIMNDAGLQGMVD